MSDHEGSQRTSGSCSVAGVEHRQARVEEQPEMESKWVFKVPMRCQPHVDVLNL